MQRLLLTLAALLFASVALAQDGVGDEDTALRDDAESVADDDAGNDAGSDDRDRPAAGEDPNNPKTMSGMSILGNEEAPKSLIIIPWKASEIGSDLGLDDGLDARAEPVDREVFLRELEFYEIRSGE